MARHALFAAAVACTLVLGLGPSTARADPLTLTTQIGAWDDAVAALRANLGSEGSTVRVSVRAGGVRVPCERYLLQLDEAAGSAFRATACDPATQETWLVLARRAALFDEGHEVPVPRTVSITAILRATAVAQGSVQGGSLVRCSVAVRPYLDDALHGTRVMLTPEHYALRPGSASISVSPDPGGWSLSTTERATFRIRYEVLDRATGAVVLQEDATLSCGPDAPTQPAVAPPTPSAPVVSVVSMEPSLASVDEQLARLEAEIAEQERESRRLDEDLDGLAITPRPRPPATATETNKVVGLLAIASLGASGLLFGAGAAFATNYQAQVGFFVPGGVTGVLGLATGSVYLMQRFKKAVRPAISFSGQGATFGARGSF